MSIKGKRIFYVEDDLRNRSVVQMLVEQTGAELGFERWGRDETIKKLREFGQVDLILLDLMFPNNVSGYDIYKTIRQHSEFDNIPIAAISAADPSIEMTKARHLGFSGYIAKPISLHKFIDQIANLITGHSVWSAV